MTVDLGCGDGRAVLTAAAARPDRLAVGVDASDAAMAEASRRAGRKPGHGGLENALFVVAAAEAPPAELEGVADLVTVQFRRQRLGGGHHEHRVRQTTTL